MPKNDDGEYTLALPRAEFQELEDWLIPHERYANGKLLQEGRASLMLCTVAYRRILVIVAEEAE